MTNTFCTIITANYYAYALSLFASLSTNSEDNVNLHVFVSDAEVDYNFFSQLEAEHTGLHFFL